MPQGWTDGADRYPGSPASLMARLSAHMQPHSLQRVPVIYASIYGPEVISQYVFLPLCASVYDEYFTL
jgi:hypothetical protein